MKNNNYSHMDVDPAFEPLIELEHAISPTRVRAYRAYRQWVVGYSEEEIATFFSIPTDEVATDLEYIRELLPAETVALNIRERNEILESKESASKLIEELATDMFPSAEEIIQAGKNPVDILRRFRKVVTSDDPLKMIPELRRENSRAAIKDHDVDLSERDNSLIAELCGRKPAQPIMPENSEKYEYPCDPTEQTSPASAGPDQSKARSIEE